MSLTRLRTRRRRMADVTSIPPAIAIAIATCSRIGKYTLAYEPGEPGISLSALPTAPAAPANRTGDAAKSHSATVSGSNLTIVISETGCQIRNLGAAGEGARRRRTERGGRTWRRLPVCSVETLLDAKGAPRHECRGGRQE